jgi:Zn-dependent peptidase ImmA (M78 family)
VAKRPTKESVPFNPDLLRWAREWSGRSIEEAAERLNKKPEDVAKWESSAPAAPTVRQARQLADFYERHFLEFFLPAPPDIPRPALVRDFRMHAGMVPPTDSRELLKIQQWADAQRVNALDLIEEVGDLPPQIPLELFRQHSQAPEIAASTARAFLEFKFDDQSRLAASQADLLPNILRRTLEKIGILALKENDLRDFGVRGICIAVFPLPVIVFSDEAPTAQAFTLMHEFGHVLIRQSGITGPRDSNYQDQPVESWCDMFAAAFLMPGDIVTRVAGPRPNAPTTKIEDAELKRIAGAFRVSPHAMLIRLVHLGYVTPSYYWDVKKPEFDRQDRQYKRFARPTYYGARYRGKLGDFYTGLVLEAWSSGRITNHHAAEYMGIKNLGHIYDIRNAFRSV